VIWSQRSRANATLLTPVLLLMSPACTLATGESAPAEQPPPMASASLTDWRALPTPQDLHYWQFSSRDPERRTFADIDFGNKDFNNFIAVCGERPAVRDQTVSDPAQCEPGLAGYLIAADDGPGFVSRMFFPATTRDPGFGAERIRIYVDDMDAPVYEGALVDWRAGTSEPLSAPLTAWTSGASVSRVPIVYQRKLRVLLDRLSRNGYYYYHVDVQRGGAGTGFPLVEATQRFAQLREQVRSAADADSFRQHSANIAPGAALTLFDERGSGTIERLTIDLTQPARGALDDLALRIYWEDAEAPALDLPLATLFGCRDQLASFETLPLSVRLKSSSVELVSSWPMPFFQHARLLLVNSGSAAHAVSVQVAKRSVAPEPAAGHFHAVWNQRRAPFSAHDRYPVAALSGGGKYLGTLMFLHGQVDAESATPYAMGFLEGDERIVVDGETVSQGTGTEDYFDAGWYFRDGRFDSPFATLIALAKDRDTGRGSATMARWHVLSDAIEFRDSFELSFEYGANRPDSASDYASVAFYYSAEQL
jgi:Protein of unknown function (DUF2961)